MDMLLKVLEVRVNPLYHRRVPFNGGEAFGAKEF